jgi:hypothetical protein
MEPQKMEAWSDLLGILDLKLMDKVKVKAGAAQAIDGLKPATKFFADLDDMLWDQLKNVLNTFIDKLGVVEPLTVGDAEVFTKADVDAFLGTFDSVDAEVKKTLRKKPKLLKLVKEEFTAQEQAKLVGNPILIGLLSIFGPLVIQFLKDWLSKN